MPVLATPSKASKAEDMIKRYGLEPVSESVVHLTRLIARQDAVAEEIARVIVRDKALTARMLRFANPRAESEQDYTVTTVEEALMRTGLAPVILLAMLDPLTRAVIKAFDMFHTPLTSVPFQKLPPFTGQHVLGTVEFSGKAAGVVHIRLEPRVAQRLAAAIIGVKSEELTNPAEIDDVIGELVNIVAGNLKSNLCDAGITCKLTTPRVSRTTDFQKKTVSGGVSERLAFAGLDHNAFVDLSVNPWSE
ncbi:MAG: chemotaxis protein CheX [Verrucomicrobiales bacterium]|nr:chemotaxis protein CheX [Verrucomicrobiales bacterium]